MSHPKSLLNYLLDTKESLQSSIEIVKELAEQPASTDAEPISLQHFLKNFQVEKLSLRSQIWVEHLILKTTDSTFEVK